MELVSAKQELAGHRLVRRGNPAQHKRVMSQGFAKELSPSDQVALMERVAGQGEREAFAKLFGHFAPRIKSYLRSLKADDAQAEDLVQEVMLTVWRRASQFDSRQASLSTWIFTIARNKRIDAIRREKRPEIDPDDPALVPEAETMPDDSLHQQQQSDALQLAIRKLPDEQSLLLRLSYFMEKTHAEIAEELGLPLGTVKSRLRLAMTKLRGLMEE